jgi:hypothetical protein
MPLIPVMPAESTVTGMINSTDVGKLVTASSHLSALMVGSTADISKVIQGIVASVPDNTTSGSTTLFYIQPLTQYDVVEADYSTATARSTSFLLASSNLGYYFGVSNTTTVAGAANLDPSVAGKTAGTTSGLFFKLLGYSTEKGTMWGLLNSSHLALS